MSLGFVGFSAGPAATGANQHSAFTAVSCAPGAVRQLVAPPAYSVLHSPATCGPQSSGFVPDRGSFRLPFIDVDAVFQNEIANAYQTAQEDASMHYMRVGPPMGGPLLAETAAASYYNVHPNMRNGEGAFAHPAGPSEGSCPQGVMGRYVCAICGDRATGKHYGVVSCEGCKGFFKRTIRKNLQYACREERHCPIDKRQRNRCQFCRFEKCLTTGMKREAVQEERARAKLRVSNLLTTPTSTSLATPGTSSSHESPSTSTVNSNTLPATPTPDLRTLLDEFVAESDDEQHAARAVVGWAKRVRSFAELPIDDRIALLRAGWNELLIATLAHRNAAAPDRPRRTNPDSTNANANANTTATTNGDSHMVVDEDKKPDIAELESEETCLSFGGGIRVTRSAAHRAGVGQVFDRVQTEIVEKMRQLAVDRVELELIRAIILFNPDARGVNRVGDVERARERVYAALEQYCRLRHAADDARFAKLLLRLPALRSVGLKCVEHLFFMRLFGEAPPDAAVRELLTLSSSLSSALGATSEADRSLLQAQLA